MSIHRRLRMRQMLIALVSAVCLSAGSAGPAGAQSAAEVNSNLDTLFGDHKPYEQFFAKLKTAVADGDKETVASMIDYPFQARISGKAVKIRDQGHFVADYDQIITSKVKNAVAKQTYETLVANWQGVMIGDGEVWFSGICNDAACNKSTIRITAIND
ncbi:hypothetical protein KXR53_32795 [Inquilinus limosus]|uniref:hypothetical protein n=1 Tax=Inquilinus limosus TaxID=171674 RepID=UPI003F13FC60